MPTTANLIVCDGSDEEGTRLITEMWNSVVLRPDEFLNSNLAGLSSIIVNVCFSGIAQAGSLRAGLSKHPAAEIIVLIDGGKNMHWQRVQANALGAKAILKRPVTQDQIVALMALYGKGRSETTVPRSIASAASAISGAFVAVRRDTRIDLSQVVSASRDIVEEIELLGTEKWLAQVRAHHEGTFQHCLLVTGAAAALAVQLRLRPLSKLELVGCALLHDIGKAKIPREILDKPGPLTFEERAVMQTHPTIAKRYLDEVGELPAAIVDGVVNHHELLDGTGYPNGLLGEKISPMTRMLTVCDIYGALTEERSYKQAKSSVASLLILCDMAGQGKVEYRFVAELAKAAGTQLPEKLLHMGSDKTSAYTAADQP